jgi:hypothetical protein
MICEFQKQHELDYADRRKVMNEKNAWTVRHVAAGMQDEVVIHACYE